MIPDNVVENILDSFRGKRVLVAGDLILDHYLEGKVDRISPEAPVPIVSLESSQGVWVPGGAANVARNIRSLGGIPLIAGVAGEDSEGRKLLKLLEDDGIDTGALIPDKDRPTTSKTRIMSDGHQLIRLDREVVGPIPLKLKDSIIQTVEGLMDTIDAVVLEDYNKGLLIPEMVRDLIDLCGNNDIPVAVDPKIRNFFSFRGCTLFKPNRLETSRALSMDIVSVDQAREAGRILLDKLDSKAVLITLGGQGSLLCRSNAEPFYRPAVARHVYDVSGAGDTVIAVMALALASGLDLEEGVRVSNFAAAATCSEPGVYAVEPSDIIREVNRYSGREDIES